MEENGAEILDKKYPQIKIRNRYSKQRKEGKVQKGLKRLKKILVACLISAFLFLFARPQVVLGSSLTALSDTMSRLKVSTASNHTIKYTTSSGVAAGQTMTVTFPSGFTIGSVDYTDIDVSWGPSTGAENELTLAATPSGSTWGAAFSGQVLTITSGTGTITAASKVIIEIGTNATYQTTGDQQITNPSSANTYTITIGGTFGDSGKIAVVTLSDDQFTVTASVDPTITFSLSANSTAFGTLSSTSVTTSSPNITLTVSTNAGNGYTITVKDAGNGTNPGLYNSDASFLIGSADYSYNNTADLSSVAGYGIQCSSASATCASPYNVSGTNVGGYELTAQNFATYSGAADNHTITLTSKAKISGSTPAGSYSDTVTVIATGNF